MSNDEAPLRGSVKVGIDGELVDVLEWRGSGIYTFNHSDKTVRVSITVPDRPQSEREVNQRSQALKMAQEMAQGDTHTEQTLCQRLDLKDRANEILVMAEEFYRFLINKRSE